MGEAVTLMEDIERGAPLDPKEAVAVADLVEGYNQRQIAARMRVSEITVWNYIRRAKRKLGASTAARVAVLFDRTRR